MRAYLFSQAVSLIGTRMSYVVLPFALIHLEFSPQEIAFILGIKIAGTAFGALLAGVIADRFNPLTIMRVADLSRFTLQALLAVIILHDLKSLLLISLVQIFFGISDSAFNPASNKFIVNSFSEDKYIKLNSAVSLLGQIAMIIGPIAGGILAATYHPSLALFIDSFSFFASFLFLLVASNKTTQPENEMRNPTQEVLSGFTYLLKSPSILRLFIASSIFHLSALAALYSLGPVYAEHNLNGSETWGLLVATFGAGGILGAIVLPKVKSFKINELNIIISLLVISTQPLVISSSLPIYIIFLLQFINGIFLSVFSIYFSSFLQKNVNPKLLGKISSFDDLLTSLSVPLGYWIIGLLAEILGVQTVMSGASILSIAVCCGIILFLSRNKIFTNFNRKKY
ncbi:MFS transporter [Rothia nasisuis]|nr:MFS transporter [Rothia nasisuis]